MVAAGLNLKFSPPLSVFDGLQAVLLPLFVQHPVYQLDFTTLLCGLALQCVLLGNRTVSVLDLKEYGKSYRWPVESSAVEITKEHFTQDP